jgi:hypothetical protein
MLPSSICRFAGDVCQVPNSDLVSAARRLPADAIWMLRDLGQAVRCSGGCFHLPSVAASFGQ